MTDRPYTSLVPPFDRRSLRFSQGMTAGLLLIAFVPDWRPMVPLVMVALALEAAWGRRYAPFLRLYGAAARSRLSAPDGPDEPATGRFVAGVGAGLLALAGIGMLAGHAGLAWVLSLVVAALGALAAATDICPVADLHARAGHPRATGPEVS